VGRVTASNLLAKKTSVDLAETVAVAETVSTTPAAHALQCGRAITDAELGHTFAKCDHFTNNFVAKDRGQRKRAETSAACNDVVITDAAGANTKQHFAAGRLRIGQISESEVGRLTE
jgi:hypothetical protein